MLTKVITWEYKIETYDSQYIMYYKREASRLDNDPKCREAWCFHGPVLLDKIKSLLTPKQFRHFREKRRNYFIRRKLINAYNGEFIKNV